MIGIKNFKMPKSCGECPFSKWEYFYCTCTITNITREDYNPLDLHETRPKRKCPLVEIKAEK
jgi:hypothetical protein